MPLVQRQADSGKITVSASEPATPLKGDLWYDTGDNELFSYNGSAFVSTGHAANETQTLTNKTINSTNNTLTNIVNSDISASADIDASKLSTGVLSNTELNLLNGATGLMKDMEFIAEVNLSGGVNAVIEKTSGLENYDIIFCTYSLRESAGSTFIPVMTYYDDAAEQTGGYGFNESVNGGGGSKLNATSAMPLDGNETGNNLCQGYVIIQQFASCHTFIGAYANLLTSVSDAPESQVDFVGQHANSDLVYGLKFEQIGGGTPTFSTVSTIRFWGLKKV